MAKRKVKMRESDQCTLDTFCEVFGVSEKEALSFAMKPLEKELLDFYTALEMKEKIEHLVNGECLECEFADECWD